MFIFSDDHTMNEHQRDHSEIQVEFVKKRSPQVIEMSNKVRNIVDILGKIKPVVSNIE